MANILVLNGPNLNMLGVREPGHYGNTGLDVINKQLEEMADEQGHSLASFQSNSEQALIEKVHQSFQNIDYILINPAAFTHTSIALRDALAAVNIPFIEIHLSNVHARESFRHKSYFSDLATGVITGLGKEGYELALLYVINYFKSTTKSSE
ncbi:MAG: type II 3-dehydroquinate dehydratase [Pseudomonadota bacterium]